MEPQISAAIYQSRNPPVEAKNVYMLPLIFVAAPSWGVANTSDVGNSLKYTIALAAKIHTIAPPPR